MVIFQGKSRYDNLIARRLIPSSVPKILEHITLDFGTFCMTLSKLCLYNSIKTSFLDNVASIITSKVFKRADTLGVLYPCLYSISICFIFLLSTIQDHLLWMPWFILDQGSPEVLKELKHRGIKSCFTNGHHKVFDITIVVEQAQMQDIPCMYVCCAIRAGTHGNSVLLHRWTSYCTRYNNCCRTSSNARHTMQIWNVLWVWWSQLTYSMINKSYVQFQFLCLYAIKPCPWMILCNWNYLSNKIGRA